MKRKNIRQRKRRRRRFILFLVLLCAAFFLIKPALREGSVINRTIDKLRYGGLMEDNVDLSEYSEAMKRLYEKNPDAREFVVNYSKDKDKYFDIDLSEYKNSDTVPLLMQWDKRWGYTSYSGDLFGLTGCGPTCLSMVTIYLTGDTEKNPRYIADYAEMNGYSVPDSGTAWALMTEGAADMGISSLEIPLNKERIDSNLEVGNPVICVMGPGDFTDSGHFIVLTGIKDGEYTVNDPNSYENSSKTWSYDVLYPQINNLWVLYKW